MIYCGVKVDLKALFSKCWAYARQERAWRKEPLRELFAKNLRLEYAGIRTDAAKRAEIAARAAAKAAQEAMPILHRIEGAIRGGGSGGRAWVARIVGPHPTYKLEREFVEAGGQVSRSGRSGTLRWDLKDEGIYELRGVQYESDRASIGTLDSGFIRIDAQGVTRITKDEAVAAAAAMAD